MFFSDMIALLRRAHGRRAHIVRTLASDSKRSIWAIADQGVVSLGNFGVNIILFREFDQLNLRGQYGDYWTLMEPMLFFNSLQAALIIYPLTVRGALSDRATHGRLTSLSLIFTMIAWPVLMLGMLITALVARIPMNVGLWAAAALLLWQIQETTRRAMLAHVRFRGAILGDVVSYLGQIAAVAVLGWTDHLTLVTTFQAMALTSGAAALIQGTQVGLGNVRWRELTDFGSECWKMSHWVLSGSLTNFIIGPVYTWNMRFWLGKEMVAINYAVTNVLRLTNPLTSVITSLITPNVVRTKERAGMHHAKMQALRFGLLGAFLLMPYLGFLFVAPTFSLALFYKWTSHVLSWSVLLQITAIGQFIIYISIVSAAFLNAVQKSRLTFRGLVVQSILTLAIGIPLTAKFGLIGAAIGAIIPTVVEIGLHLYWIRHLRDDVESSVVVDVPVMEPATQA